MIRMIDVQSANVADHIADIERAGAALRAERERDHRRAHALTGTDATDHRPERRSGRVWMGRWLVAVGEAVAGSRRPSPAPRAIVASRARDEDPCGSGDHEPLVSAA